jgi:hypothetical protein
MKSPLLIIVIFEIKLIKLLQYEKNYFIINSIRFVY